MVAVYFLERDISEDHFVAERNSDGLGESLRKNYGKEIIGILSTPKVEIPKVLQVGGRRASYKWIAVGQRICLERQG